MKTVWAIIALLLLGWSLPFWLGQYALRERAIAIVCMAAGAGLESIRRAIQDYVEERIEEERNAN